MLYPDGISDFDACDGITFFRWQKNPSIILRPCWHGGRRFITSFEERVKLMKEYDKEHGFETIFLGNV